MDAPGVTYESIEVGGQAMRLFRCPTFQADLTPESCASRHQQAQALSDKAGEAYPAFRCKYCPIGAAHAGVKPKKKRDRTCIRCGRTSDRLVGKTLCPSCFNRQQEVLKGRDRRGGVPRAVSLLLRPGANREVHAIPAIYPIAVDADGRVHRVMASTFREALQHIVRVLPNPPRRLAVINAADLARAARQG